MDKVFVRFCFCIIPALLVFILIVPFSFGVAMIAWFAVFFLGLELTERRPERGE